MAAVTKKPKIFDISTSNEGSDDINLSALFKDDPKHDLPVKHHNAYNHHHFNSDTKDPNILKLMELLRKEKAQKEAEEKKKGIHTTTTKSSLKPNVPVTQKPNSHNSKSNVKVRQAPSSIKGNATVIPLHPVHSNNTHLVNVTTTTPKSTKNEKSNSSVSSGSVLVVVISFIIASKFF